MTAQDIELGMLREFERARQVDDQKRMADVETALSVLRDLFGHLLVGEQ